MLQQVSLKIMMERGGMMAFNKLFGKFKKAEVEDEEEIKVQQEEMEQERQRREEMAGKMEKAINMEMQADQLSASGRFEESILKYEETGKILEEMNAEGILGIKCLKLNI